MPSNCICYNQCKCLQNWRNQECHIRQAKRKFANVFEIGRLRSRSFNIHCDAMCILHWKIQIQSIEHLYSAVRFCSSKLIQIVVHLRLIQDFCGPFLALSNSIYYFQWMVFLKAPLRGCANIGYRIHIRWKLKNEMWRDLFRHRLLTQMAKNIGSSRLLLCFEFQSRDTDIE